MADLDSSRPWLSAPKSCPPWSTPCMLRLQGWSFTAGASQLRLHGPQDLPVVGVGKGRPRLCEGNPPQQVHLAVGGELLVGGTHGLHRPVADALRPSLPIPVVHIPSR